MFNNLKRSGAELRDAIAKSLKLDAAFSLTQPAHEGTANAHPSSSSSSSFDAPTRAAEIDPDSSFQTDVHLTTEEEMAKKKAAKAKKKSNNQYVAAAAAEAAAAAAVIKVEGLPIKDGVADEISNGCPNLAVDGDIKHEYSVVRDAINGAAEVKPTVGPNTSKNKLKDVNGKIAVKVEPADCKNEVNTESATPKQSSPLVKTELATPSVKKESDKPSVKSESAMTSLKTVPTTSLLVKTESANPSVKTEPATRQQPPSSADSTAEIVKEKSASPMSSPNIERMTSSEEGFPSTYPGRPFCREWVQSNQRIKFVVTFPDCQVTPETTSVEVSPDRCLIKHRPPEKVAGGGGATAVEEESQWAAKLWGRVSKDSTCVLIRGKDVHVQCEKENVDEHWEKLFEPRTEAEIMGFKEEEECVDLTLIRHSWYEKTPDLVVIQVYVKEVAPKNLFVDFKEDALHFRFRTSDAAFLKLQSGGGEEASTPISSSTLFRWSIRLKNSVDPAACRFKMSRNNVEIVLKKLELGHWRALEASSVPRVNSSDGAVGKDSSAIDRVVSESPSIEDDVTTIASTKSTPVTNSKPTYSNVSHLRGNNASLSDTEVSPSAVSGSPSLCSPPAITNHCNTTTVAASTTKPTCMVSPLPPAVASSRYQRQREVRVDELETNAASSRPGVNGSRNSSSVGGLSSVNNRYNANHFGMTGLDNMGNTCFMNSVLQCLANTRELRDFFLTGRFQKDLNKDNPLGLGGNLAISYAVLLKVLWSGANSSYAPSKLKSLVAQKASQFTGFAQHDAQEFLAFLLDGLHEDLNRVVDKPYTTPVEANGRPDEVVADEAWHIHRKRNNSEIVDLFSGQYKSKLTCPVCEKVSVTFDPFTYLTIPLPKKKQILPVTLVWRDPHKTPLKFLIPYSKESGTVEDLKRCVAEKTSNAVLPVNLRVFEVVKGRVHRVFERGAKLDAVQPTDQIFIAEKLDRNLAPGEKVVDVIVMQRTLSPSTVPTRCSFCRKDCLEGFKLKRCTKCLIVGYCDVTCQRSHWSVHKPICRKTPEPIGIPFALSLPESQITYRRLVHYLQSFAAFSVDTFRPPASNNAGSNSNNIGMDNRSNNDSTTNVSVASCSGYESTSSEAPLTPESPVHSPAQNDLNRSTDDNVCCGKEDDQTSVSEDGDSSGFVSASSSACASLVNTPSEEHDGSMESSSADSAADTDSTAAVAPERPARVVHGILQTPEEVKPSFLIRAVDQRGISVLAEINGDQGADQLIDLSDKPFLAMDWKNNVSWEDSVMISSRANGFQCADGDVGANAFAGRVANRLYQQQSNVSGPLFNSASSTKEDEEGGLLSVPTLDQCLDKFTEAEILGEDDLWYCPSCKEHQQASKQMTLWKLPKILLLHLKRFSFRNFIWRDKITKFVDFPLRGLDLIKYCPSLSSSSSDNVNCIYDLYAVINHFGGIMGGHYTAYARLPLEGESSASELPWRLFDDSHVTTVSRDADVVTRNAYVLFYVRRDEPDVAASLAAASAATAAGFTVPTEAAAAAGDYSGSGLGDRGVFAGDGRSTTTRTEEEEEYQDAGSWRKGSDASTCTEDTFLSSAGTDCDEID